MKNTLHRVGLVMTIAFAASIAVFAQQQSPPVEIAPEKFTRPLLRPAEATRDSTVGRFQIIQIQNTTLKLDTVTGETWHLQFTADGDKQMGVYYAWTAIPAFGLPQPK